MKLIYIAGPFRGKTPWDVEENIRRAERVGRAVWQVGAAALCPHANTRYFDKSADDHIFLEGTLEMLRRCDAVVLVLGWEKSSGTRAEIAEALRRRIPVFEQEDFSEFRMWMQGKPFTSMSNTSFSLRVDNYNREHKY